MLLKMFFYKLKGLKILKKFIAQTIILNETHEKPHYVTIK